MDEVFRSRLPRLVADAQAHYGVPGVAVAAVGRDGKIDRLALGTDSRGAPLDADSLFPVASLTKLATALTVLRLADDGLVGVDDPLARHLPGALAYFDPEADVGWTILGARTAHNGWVLRAGPTIGAALLTAGRR